MHHHEIPSPNQKIFTQPTGVFHAYERLSSYEYQDILKDGARLRLAAMIGRELLDAISDGRRYQVIAEPACEVVIGGGDYQAGKPYLYQKVTVKLIDPFEAKVGEYACLVVGHQITYHEMLRPTSKTYDFSNDSFDSLFVTFHRDEIGWKRVG